MANSTTNLDTISSGQSQKEVTANELFDAGSPATVFGRRASTTTGLTWGYYGGRILVDGALTTISNGTVALTASATNYVEATRAGVVSKNTTGFTAGRIPLYTVVAGASSVTSYTDERTWARLGTSGILSKSVAGSSNVTLTAAEARNQILIFTGALTGNINVYVPLAAQQWTVLNNTSGAFTLTVIGTTGTGVQIPQSSTLARIVYSDGTNVIQAGDGGGSLAMDDLNDVNTAGVANGDVLVWNSGTSTWTPAAASSGTLAGLTDVDTTGANDGDLLSYDSGTSKWIPSTAGASPVGKNTIWIPASAMTARTTNGAASGTSESTTNKIMQLSLDFDQATQEFAQFSVAFPKSWNESTVTAQFFWTAASGSGDVVWGLQGVAVSNDDVIDVAFGTAQEVSDTLIATGDLHLTSETSAITIGGTPADGDLTFFQVYRDPADVADTLTGDAKLLGVKLYYTTDSVNDA